MWPRFGSRPSKMPSSGEAKQDAKVHAYIAPFLPLRPFSLFFSLAFFDAFLALMGAVRTKQRGAGPSRPLPPPPPRGTREHPQCAKSFASPSGRSVILYILFTFRSARPPVCMQYLSWPVVGWWGLLFGVGLGIVGGMMAFRGLGVIQVWRVGVWFFWWVL